MSELVKALIELLTQEWFWYLFLVAAIKQAERNR